MICGVEVVYAIQFCTDLHFLLYMTIAIVVTFMTGYLVSLLTGSNKKDLTNLTLFTMVKSQNEDRHNAN